MKVFPLFSFDWYLLFLMHRYIIIPIMIKTISVIRDDRDPKIVPKVLLLFWILFNWYFFSTSMISKGLVDIFCSSLMREMSSDSSIFPMSNNSFRFRCKLFCFKSIFSSIRIPEENTWWFKAALHPGMSVTMLNPASLRFSWILSGQVTKMSVVFGTKT